MKWLEFENKWDLLHDSKEHRLVEKLLRNGLNYKQIDIVLETMWSDTIPGTWNIFTKTDYKDIS